MDISREIMSNLIIYSKYAKYLPDKNRRETWDEIITRNMNMHIKSFPKLKDEIINVYSYVFDKKVLPSMRSLQFSGRPIEIANNRLYNCAYIAIDNVDAFSETMFLLLGGTGVGYSVQTHHIEKLPEIIKPKKTRRFLVADSIEGWADSVKVLVEAFMGTRKALPLFDFSDIRPKGAELKTAGGKAPGPEPLKTCLFKIQSILERKNDGDRLTALEAHDIICYISDAVLSGGIRRSACIALFSYHDNDMLECKFGKWYELNPQRGRANNTVVLLRHKIKEKDFYELWDKMINSGSGEPGFMMSNDMEIGCNPCGEISLKSKQFCNLVEVNVSDIVSQDDLDNRARAAAFIATLQASYTNFHYLSDGWKVNTEKDALIGVGLTGIASGKIFKFNLKQTAQFVVEENERVSALIGTSPAIRTTTVKPSGTASLVLGCSSGVHPWFSKYYIRRIRVLKNEPLYLYLNAHHKELLEDDYFQPNIQAIISIPIKAPVGAITSDESPLDLLERVKYLHENWIKPGHKKGHNTNNVSCTVLVTKEDSGSVGKWMWENRDSYAALSILPKDENTYIQPPYEAISKAQYDSMVEILKTVDFSKVYEYEDGTNLSGEAACAGGACEIK